jgi:hypothetical protein
MEMPVHLVLDYPRRHRIAHMWRALSALAGSVMLLGAFAFVPVFLFLLFAVIAENRSGGASRHPSTDASGTVALISGIVVTISILGALVGLRLIRGTRALVLFLRRFRYGDASRAVTFAVAKTIGRSWRLVTLDDAAIAAVGIATGTKRLLRWEQIGLTTLGRAWKSVLMLSMYVLGGAVTGMVGVVVITILHHEDPATLLETALRANQPTPWSLPGAFRIFLAVTFIAAAVGLAVSLLAVAAFAFIGWYFVFSWSAERVRRAEQSSRAAIQTTQAIATVGRSIARQARKIFCPRLMVLDVATDLWRATVRHLARDASVILIDVSEPSENLLWEIQEVAAGFGSRCVLVGQYERVRHLATDAREALPPEALAARLATLLDNREVLAYTTDRHGMKRFARSLRGKLQTVSA